MSISTIIFNKNIIPSDQLCIKYNDRGFTLGHGIYETILIKNGSIPAMDYHWKRLETSAPIIGITIPFSSQELEFMIHQLIEQNNLQNKLAAALFTITYGESRQGLLATEASNPNFVISVFEHVTRTVPGYSAIIASTKKNEQALSARMKSTSNIDNILAKQEAVNLGYNEAFLLNTSSNIADGSMTNIFMIKNSQVFTPQVTDGALPGIIRSILLEEFSQLFSITEKSISLSEIMDADEIFITNALLGIGPITKLNTKEFHSFPITTSIENALREKKNYV